MSDTVTRLSLDRGEKLIVAETVQDVEPILERNKQIQSEPQKSDWGRHVATIPNVILLKWFHEEGACVWRMSSREFGAFIKKKLNDPDYRHLRTDK